MTAPLSVQEIIDRAFDRFDQPTTWYTVGSQAKHVESVGCEEQDVIRKSHLVRNAFVLVDTAKGTEIRTISCSETNPKANQQNINARKTLTLKLRWKFRDLEMMISLL